RVPAPRGPLAFGEVPGGLHLRVPAPGLDASAIAGLAARSDSLIVTPWHGVLVPSASPSASASEEQR
ncbi:MAG: hypothetical protein QM572_01195, partial [Nocardioides sp.]